MKIINPFQMNDWPIKSFILFVLSFQLSLWGVVGLDFVGLKIYFLRQLVCIIYLTFIPGIIALRILKFHKISNVETLLYGVGLSISILMFIGYFINIFYPFIGISKPISLVPLIITISLIVLLLSVICYKVDKDFLGQTYTHIEQLTSAPFLFLCIIPLLTILGTYLMNSYKNNLLLMIMVLMIALIIIMVCLNIIPVSLYPLAVYTISFSLLFQNSLISTYISGWDIQTEYYMASLVIKNSAWNSNLYSNINAMLSIVILAPIYSIISDLNLTWVFKIVYPIIFSLLPLALYRIFQRQTDDKIAFMSTFFLMSFFVFYTEMLQLARQQIAEFFFALMLLLVIQNKYNVPNRILLILFGFSIIVSHYGLSYIIVGSMVLISILLYFYNKYFEKISQNNTINVSLALLLLTTMIAWYLFISKSSALHSAIHIADNVVTNFIQDFMNPEKAQGIYIITKKTDTNLHEIAKLMHVISQIFISIGLVYISYLKFLKKESKFKKEYFSLCVVFYLILLVAIVAPDFASSLNTSRLYQITLLLLAPFCIIGGIVTINAFYKIWIIAFDSCNNIISKKLFNSKSVPYKMVVNNNYKNFKIDSQKFISDLVNISYPNSIEGKKISLKLLSVSLSIFLLFNTGWIYQLVGDSPTSYSLNKDMDYPMFSEKDIVGKNWMCEVYDYSGNAPNPKIYADYYRFPLFRSSFELQNISIIPVDSSNLPRGSYIYYSSFNNINNKILLQDGYGANNNISYYNAEDLTSVKNKIYNNGGAIIYRT